MYKTTKIKYIPEVYNFFSSMIDRNILDSIDVYIMPGIVADSHMQPAYALFYNGDEQNKKVYLLDKKISYTILPESPIIIVSNNIVNDRLLYLSTIAHEVSHVLKTSEKFAIKMEKEFLVYLGLTPEEAKRFIKNKYIV